MQNFLGGEPSTLVQDNAPPHTADAEGAIDAEMTEIGSEILHHPPYSPDLAPSDYFLFGGLKKHLAGTKFSSNEDVMGTVDRYFQGKSPNFHSKGLKALEQW